MSKRYLRVTVEGPLLFGRTPRIGDLIYLPGQSARRARMATVVTAVEELPEPRTPEQERDAAIAALRELRAYAPTSVTQIAAKHGITLVKEVKKDDRCCR